MMMMSIYSWKGKEGESWFPLPFLSATRCEYKKYNLQVREGVEQGDREEERKGRK